MRKEIEATSILSSMLLRWEFEQRGEKTDAKVAQFFKGALKECQLKNQVSHQCKKYLLKEVNPDRIPGVASRVEKLYQALYPVYSIIRSGTETDLQLIAKVYQQLAEQGWLTMLETGNAIELTDAEKLKLHTIGAIFLRKLMSDKAIGGDFAGVFIVDYYVPNHNQLHHLISAFLCNGFCPVSDRVNYAIRKITEMDLISVSSQRTDLLKHSRNNPDDRAGQKLRVSKKNIIQVK